MLVGTDFWKGLVDWIQNVVQMEEKNIRATDLELFTLVDTAEEAVKVIDTFYGKYMLSPNF